MKTRIFIASAGVILAVTAFAKIFGANQQDSFNALRNTLFPFMANREVMLGTAAIELTTVVALLWMRDPVRRLALIAWLSSMFLVYRVAIHFLQASGSPYVPCPCLANAASWLRIDPAVLDGVMKAILGYLLAGSYGLLIAHRFQRRRVSTASPQALETCKT